MAFPVGWTWRCKGTIAAAYVGSGGVSDFSKYLCIETAFLTAARVDRGDVRWSLDAAGTTQLPADYMYDEDGYAFWRAKVPSISSVSDTAIYAWWGKADETLPGAGSTYGRRAAYDAGWESYWNGHTTMDRTANEYTLTLNGDAAAGATPPAPLIGPAYNMGSTGWLASSAPVARVTGASTVMFFAHLGNQAETRVTGVNNPNQWLISTQTSQRCHHAGGSAGVSTASGFRTDNAWMMLDLTWNGTTRVLSRDVVTTSSTSSGYPNAGGTFHLGANPSGTAPTGGYYTHISTHTVARSAAWRETEMNQILFPTLTCPFDDPEYVGPTPSGFRPWFYRSPRIYGAS